MRLNSGKPQSIMSIPCLPPPMEPDWSLIWNAKPVELVSFDRSTKLPQLMVIDIGFRRRTGDSSCFNGGIHRQICTFDVISVWNAICVLLLPRVSLFLILVREFRDMMIHLCMCKGRTHYTNGLESKSYCKMANMSNFRFPITVPWVSNSYLSDERERLNFGESCHRGHRKSGQCSIPIWLHDNCHAAFTHLSNCITLHTDLVRMAEIFEIAYGTSWKSRRLSCTRNWKEVEL